MVMQFFFFGGGGQKDNYGIFFSLPLLAVNMSIILPGVQTMISAPRFSSAI